MKNNILYIFIVFFFYISIISNVNSNEQFNFDVTEVEILKNGNLIKGLKRGTVTDNNGVTIDANQFEYDKLTNILTAVGNVKVRDTINNQFINADTITYYKNLEEFHAENNVTAEDKINNYIINADTIIYYKNLEEFHAENNVTAVDKINNYIINSDTITYYRNLEKIVAIKNVKVKDTVNNYRIFSDEIIYLKKIAKISSLGKTKVKIQSEYIIDTEDLIFLINENNLSSKKKTTVKKNNSEVYYLDKFRYLIDINELKGENILVITNYNLPISDKIYFSNGSFNLKKQNFLGKDTEVKIHKNIFGDIENDPRIMGVSAKGDATKTLVNKGIFTSCKQDDNCPPWSISAEQIVHDKQKKEISYKNAWLKIYDIPILYFPKFFHPDPTVNRRSGFLKPQFNSSDILGSSFAMPYFSVIAENRDFTFVPYFFEDDLQMFQNEYREINKNSEFIANFGYINNYKTSISSKKKSVFNLFSKLNLDLNFENFDSSNLYVSIEKVTNDTYLKVFESNIQNNFLKPEDFNILKNELKLSLDHENYNFISGIQIFENLQKESSDRHEYILPYYNFNTTLSENFSSGVLNFSSNGDNVLNNTNKLTSRITNDLNYIGSDHISSYGFKNNIEIYLKNLNSAGKNNSEYKSSPQIELMSLIDLSTSLPLVKEQGNYNNFLTPKLSFKINPSDMKNYSNSDKTVNTDNIFGNNRLGISDSLEAGRSLTLGLDYRKEEINNLEKFFEIKLATVLRDKEENFVPKKTTLNKKSSNLFGSITTSFTEYLNLDYNFAIDNDYNTFEYNNISTEFTLNNFETKFSFVEESGEMGDSNYIENNTSFNFDNSNSIKFGTRRNRKLNLTEYYDLVYEYKNDCLTAGIKYKKTYYEDRDLKPAENLFFSVTLIPLTTYEQKIDRESLSN